MAFRPTLRPGAALLRRDATHLQVGTSPGTVVADQPGLFRLLRLLDGTRDAAQLAALVDSRIPELDSPIRPLLAELLASGAVVDAAALAPRRTSHVVRFDTDRHCELLADTAAAILTASGLTPTPASDADLLVISSCGESARDRFERAVLLGTPHLVVVRDEDRVRIGPLVQPGATPCVNCHDLHRAAWDPAWPALMHQFGRAAVTLTCPSLTAPTLYAAAAEIAVEVLAHADGQRPRTAGRYLMVGPRHDERVMRDFGFHSACSCDLLFAA